MTAIYFFPLFLVVILLLSVLFSKIGPRSQCTAIGPWRRLLILLGIGVLAVAGAGTSIYYGGAYWRVYSIFIKNFAMPFGSIHQLKGEESAWMGYSAWVSFTYDGTLKLARPEDYREVPCTTEMMKFHDPFVGHAEFLRERRPQESFRLYEQYLKELEGRLVRLQCKEGQTNFRVTTYGERRSDFSRLIYDPQTHQVLFDIP
jgi:hypothetical protein